MSRKVADVLCEMLANAGVKRCYGIVGDALNPIIDALRRNGNIEFIHVRHEEYGVFAAVSEAYLTGDPVAVCGTAGPGVVHLFNGLMDARKEGAPIIAIAGDVETSILDTFTLEELNPYKFFDTASLYTARVVDPEQARSVFNTAILTAVLEKGPTVISLPGNIASMDVEVESTQITIPATPLLRPADADLNRLVEMIDNARTVAIFGGDGCRYAHDEVVALAEKLKAPVGYALRGKQWLEHDNPNAVGMTGLIGYGGAYGAINEADKSTLNVLLERVQEKTESLFLERHIAETNSFHDLLQHYVDKGPDIKPIRPEFLAKTLSDLASDDALFFADTGTAVIWLARHISGGRDRRLFGSFSWASMANAAPNAFGAQLAYPGRQTIALCGDGGYAMLALGDLLTQVERKTPVVQVILNNAAFDFVKIEQQEAGFIPYGVDFKSSNFAKIAEAMGAKGIRVEEPGDVREALAEALAYKDGPVVVDALVDPFALAMPSHVPFHTVKGFTLSVAKQVLNGRMDSVIRTMERNIRLV